MKNSFFIMRRSKRKTNVFLVWICYFASFFQEMACTPCETPLGVHNRPPNSSLTFEVLVTTDNTNSVSLWTLLAWKPHDNSGKVFIQIRASETVLLTGLLLEESEKGGSQMTGWSLGLSEDCEKYKEENYSLPTEKSEALNGKIKVPLHNLSFAKCISLSPFHFKGNASDLRYELLGCEIGTDNRLCKEDSSSAPVLIIPETEEISHTDERLSSFNINHLSGLEESSNTEKSNLTDMNTEQDLINGSEPLNIDDIHSLFASINASSENEDLQTEIIRNITDGKILRENGLFREDTKLQNETEATHLKSDLIVNDDFEVLLEDLNFLEGNGSMENGTSIDILSAFQDECGIRPFTGKYLRKKRVVLGHRNAPREWPWLASLHFLPETTFTKKSGFKHLCGASLISNQWLVSAGHCFSNKAFDGLENLTEWRVYLGLHDQALTEENDSVQKRNISLLLRHSQGGKGFEADIALIKLDRPVEFSDSVRPICLDETDIFFENAVCYASGWGQRSTVTPGTRFPYTAALSILKPKECEETYADLPHDHVFKEYVRTGEDMVCAQGPGGEDTCQGDSGGGLMCTIDNTWHLVGITSGGYECGRKNFPAFYTRISFHKKWIKMNLEAYDRF